MTVNDMRDKVMDAIQAVWDREAQIGDTVDEVIDIVAAQARADLIAEMRPVAVVVSAYGDPEAFAERELGMLTSIQAMPIGTRLAIIPKE